GNPSTLILELSAEGVHFAGNQPPTAAQKILVDRLSRIIPPGRISAGTPVRLYLFEGELKRRCLPGLGEDSRALANHGTDHLYFEAGAGGSQRASIYATQELIRELSEERIQKCLDE